MEIKEQALVEYCEDMAGYCQTCDEITEHGGVHPDDEGRRCPICQNMTLMSSLKGSLYGFIRVSSDDKHRSMRKK